jgi:plastocyanin
MLLHWHYHCGQHTEENSEADSASQPPATQPANTTAAAVINMTDKVTFDPSIITINLGQTVRWINSSKDEHTVTDDASAQLVGSAWAS